MKNFPILAMARFGAGISEQFKDQNLVPMHNTNPEPFTQSELEQTIGHSFIDILQNVDLGFAPDAGTLALRQTLAKFHYETIATDDIVTHAGAQEALFCAFYALLQAGNKVLAVAPIFEPLVQIPLNIGCEVSYVHLNSENNWSLNLDEVEENNETLIIKRKTGKGTVIISLDEYNSIMETVHLLSSKTNADRLFESIQQMKDGKSFTKNLIEVE